MCILMLPDAHRHPPCLLEQSICLGVPISIAPELWTPVGGVLLRCRAVFGASVPVAAIDEDSDLRAPKDQIGPAIEVREGSSIDAVPKAEGVDGSAYGHLRLRIPPPVALHRCPARPRGRPRYV